MDPAKCMSCLKLLGAECNARFTAACVIEEFRGSALGNGFVLTSDIELRSEAPRISQRAECNLFADLGVNSASEGPNCFQDNFLCFLQCLFQFRPPERWSPVSP